MQDSPVWEYSGLTILDKDSINPVTERKRTVSHSQQRDYYTLKLILVHASDFPVCKYTILPIYFCPKFHCAKISPNVFHTAFKISFVEVFYLLLKTKKCVGQV
jgi:hypothetical protein